MLTYIISLTILTLAVIVLRWAFKKNVSARLTYAIWLAVVLRLCLPFDLVQVDMPTMSFDRLETVVAEELSVDVKDLLGRFDKAPATEEENAPPENVMGQNPKPQVDVKPQAGVTQNGSLTGNSTVTGKPNTGVGNPAANENPAVNEGITQTPSPNEEVSSTNAEENKAPLTSETPAENTVSVAEVLGVIWAAGSALTLCTFGVSYAVFYVKLRQGRRFYGKTGKTKVFVSSYAKTPCVIGIVPAIYITEEAAESESLSVILMHEKTHIAHGDHLWNLFRVVAVSAFWWNPAIWAAAVLSMRDAELACDEAVVSRLDAKDRLEYARLIVDAVPVKNFALGFSGGPIKERVMKLTREHKTGIIAAIVAVILIGGCLAVAFIGKRDDVPVDGETTQTETETDPTPTDPEEVNDLEAYKEKFHIQDELTALLDMKVAEIEKKYGKLVFEYVESDTEDPVHSIENLDGVQLVFYSYHRNLSEDDIPKEVIVLDYGEDVLGLSIGKNVEDCDYPVKWNEAYGWNDGSDCRVRGFAAKYNLSLILENKDQITSEDEEYWDNFKNDPSGKISQVRISKRMTPYGNLTNYFRVLEPVYENFVMFEEANIIRYDASTGEETFDLLLAPYGDIEDFKITRLTWDEYMYLDKEETIHEIGSLRKDKDALLLTVDSVETIGYTGVSYKEAGGFAYRAYPAQYGIDGTANLVEISELEVTGEITYAGLPRYDITVKEPDDLYEELEKLRENDEFMACESKVVVAEGLSVPVYIELGEGTNISSAKAYGRENHAYKVYDSTNLCGDVVTKLYEAEGAIFLSYDCGEVGCTMVFSSGGCGVFNMNKLEAVTFRLEDDGSVKYTRFATKFDEARENEYAPLTLARGRDEFIRETGSISINNSGTVILSPEKTETVGEAYDLDAIYEEYKNEDWFKENYPSCNSADDVMLANRNLITDIETVKAKADEGDERFKWIKNFLECDTEEFAKVLYHSSKGLFRDALDAAFNGVVFGEFVVEELMDSWGNEYMAFEFEITSSDSDDFPVGDYLIRINYHTSDNSIANISFLKRAGVLFLDYEGYEDYFTRRIFNYFCNEYTDVTSPIATLIAYSLYTKVNDGYNKQPELTQEQIEEVGKIIFGEGYEFEDYRLVCAMEKDGVKYYHPVGMGGTSAYHSIISRTETDETITYDVRYHADSYYLTTAFVMRYTFEKVDSEYMYRFVSVELLESNGLDNYTFST